MCAQRSRPCERANVRELEWKKLARRDLLRIVRKIGEDNPDAAEAFAEMVDAKALALPARPEMYRVSKRVPNAREMVVHRNYLVFYRVSARFITILRIKHARQQWPKA